MKIKCITNKTHEVPLEILSNYTSINSSIPLIINKEYLVYAVSEYYKNIWYCICDESYTYYPMWIPYPFFEITDYRLSRYWIFSIKEGLEKKQFFLGFSEWANQIDFYDNLTDGEKEEIKIFRAYKELMDLEFSDFSISETAQIGDEEWLMCPTCIDAWQNSDKRSVLVRCPICLNVFNNPRYKDEYPHF